MQSPRRHGIVISDSFFIAWSNDSFRLQSVREFCFLALFASSASKERHKSKWGGTTPSPNPGFAIKRSEFALGAFYIDWSFTAPPTFFPGSRWLPRFHNPIRKGLQHEFVHQKDKQRLLCPHGTHGKSPGRRPAVSPGRPVLLPHGQGGQHRGHEGGGVHPLRNVGDAGRHRPLGAGGQLSQPVQRRRQPVAEEARRA